MWLEKLVNSFRDIRWEELGEVLKTCTNSVVLTRVKVNGLARVVLWHTLQKTIKESC